MTTMDGLSPIDCDEYKTVARRIGLAIRELDGQGWQAAQQKFLALEPELLALFKSEADRREVRRRIREVIISDLSVADPAPDASAYERHWQKMLELGFSNDERRMSMHFFRLSYLIDNVKEGSGVVAELERYGEAAETLTKTDRNLGEHFLQVHRRLQTRLAQRGA
jgi:hypothetical protein